IDWDKMNATNKRLIDEYRANNGKVSGRVSGTPLLLLITTGAKSGQERIAPVNYTREGDRFVIIASKAGAPTHPDWYHNLLAQPEATVEFGSERFSVRATFPEGNERQRLFDQMAAQMPYFAEYQRNTTRLIPVVLLERAD